MSLNWDMRENTRWPRDPDGSLTDRDTLDTIIFMTMVTDIGELKTDKDADDWYFRYAVWCRAMDSPPILTLAEVHRALGLRTNVFPRLSDAQWFAKLRKVLDRERDHIIKEVDKASAHQHRPRLHLELGEPRDVPTS